MKRNRFWSGLMMGGFIGTLIGWATSQASPRPRSKGRLQRTYQNMSRIKRLITNTWRQMSKG
ncbi:MAG: hypothetical protein GX952_01930 [Firmicutes bacterium]|nr:hypothetical protein [Bacillota bacterium]